jgi:tagatose-1,6-bisphosphate aldolase non-catalytic subunit AgaZ/GatZ
MTPETREELARAIAPNARDWSARYRDARKTADAIAPIIERLVAERVAALTAERDAAVAMLAEITPSRLIGESHVPYPEGKTTVLMSWDWLRRVRAIERNDHLTAHKPLDT